MNTASSHPMRRATLPGVLALALAAAFPAAAQDAAAQDAAAPAAAPAAEDAPQETVLRFDAAITPEARAIMDRMKATLNGLQRASLTAEVSRDETLTYGYKLQHNEFVKMEIERPNRLRVDVRGDLKDRVYYYDGAEFTVHARDLDVYAKKPLAGTIRDLVGELLDRGVDMPLIDMLYQGQAGDLLDDVRVGIVVGESSIEGDAVTHLAFRQPDVDWQIWISQGAQALPRKILITTRYSVGDPQYQAVLKWNTAPRFAADTFKFTPAKGVTQIKINEPAVASSGGAQ